MMDRWGHVQTIGRENIDHALQSFGVLPDGTRLGEPYLDVVGDVVKPFENAVPATAK